jgi:hypothetical protein
MPTDTESSEEGQQYSSRFLADLRDVVHELGGVEEAEKAADTHHGRDRAWPPPHVSRGG